jgi:hypothetical protein
MTKINNIVIFIALLLLAKNLVRDLQLEELGIGDLRNRIVGARLQKNGISPYFYKWKKGESIRYYDPLNDNGWKVSACTASPFFHTLLYPLTELPYPTTSKLWIFVLYILLIATTILAILISKNTALPIACFICVAFTFTETWLDTIVTKQSYLFIPFFAMLIYFFLKKGSTNKWLYILAGAASVFLLLTRPTTIFFFLPLIFIHKKYSASDKLLFFLPVLLGLIITLSTSQSTLWRDYFESVSEHIKIHQGLDPATQSNDKGNFTAIEGFNIEGYHNNGTEWYKAYVESSSFFVMINLISGYRIPPGLLLLCCGITMLVFTALFYGIRKKRTIGISPEAVLILGYCLYLISDLGAPIYRGHYNVVQWLFPLLLIPATFQARYLWLYLLMLTALFLNIHYKPFLPMQHALAEYIWLASFLIYAFVYNENLTTQAPPVQPGISRS